jgi:hypothetical protein
MPPQTLTPDPGTLGLHAPTLGPWFSADRVRIGAVEADLATPLTWADGAGEGESPSGADAWFLPPAGGTFTLRRVGAAHPGPLAELRLPDGRPAFPPVPGGSTGAAGPPGRVVALHRLLPQVEARLARLFRRLPVPGGGSLPEGAGEEPLRPVPRWFVLDFRQGPLALQGDIRAGLDALVDRLPDDGFYPPWVDGGGSPDDRLRARLRHLGMSPAPPEEGPVTGADSGPREMQRLARPAPSGSGASHPARLFRLRSGGSSEPLPLLRVFDSRGWPLDPGAVAAWFAWLVRPGSGGIPNLHVEHAGGGSPPPRRIARGTDEGRGLLVQLRAPGGGAPPGAVLARTTVAGAQGLGSPVADAPAGPDGAPDPQARLLWRQAGPDAPPAGEGPPPTGQVSVGFLPPPAPPAEGEPPPPDPAPFARAALLPAGRLGSQVTVAGVVPPAPAGEGGTPASHAGPDRWIGGGAEAPGLVRDHVQVAVVCLEGELVGQPRVRPPGLPPEAPDSDPRVRGAADQNRVTTRTLVGPVARDAFLPTRDAAAAALLEALAPAGGEAEDPGDAPAQLAPRTHLVAPALDRRWGPVPDPEGDPAAPPPLDGLPDVDPPAGPPPPGGWALHGLAGGGEASDGVIRRQRVLLQIAPGWAPPGAWVRVWGQRMDLRLGVRSRTDGGGGRAERDGPTAGAVHLVLELADGIVEPSVPLGLEIMVATRRGARFLADLRAPRPAPREGGGVELAEAIGPVVVCEAGLRFAAPPLADASVPPGSTVVALGPALAGPGIPEGTGADGADPPDPPPRLVRPGSIPTPAWAGPTLEQVLAQSPGPAPPSASAPGHRIRLTTPAFGPAPTGDLPAEGEDPPGGAQLLVHGRGLPESLLAGAPVLSMDRMELAAIRRRGGGPGSGAAHAGAPLPAAEAEAAGPRLLEGVVMGGPALAALHQRLPHRWAHPLSPGGPELHGVGVRLRGPGARGLREYLAERTTPHTLALVAEAFRGGAPEPDPDPAAPADAGGVGGDRLWASVLRTVAPGVETEVGLDTLAAQGYPFGQGWPQLRSWLVERLAPLVEGAGAIPGLPEPQAFLDQVVEAVGLDEATQARIQRALDRRVLGGLHGYREGATALLAAVDRAEELLYLETPVLCDLPFGGATVAGGADLPPRSFLDALVARMDARPALRLVLCLPQRPGPGLPRPMERVRHDLVRRVLQRLRQVEGAGGWGRSRGARVAVFTPAAGPARPLRMATTTVVVDDAWAFAGTTHPWRRGLTFDGSLAVSVTDERFRGGKPAEIARLRRSLLADRLGVRPGELPEDPAALVHAVRTLVARGGGDRLLQNLPHQPEHEPAARPSDGVPEGDPEPGEALPSLEGREHDLWNPEGTRARMLNVAQWLGNLLLPSHVEEIRGVPPDLPG